MILIPPWRARLRYASVRLLFVSYVHLAERLIKERSDCPKYESSYLSKISVVLLPSARAGAFAPQALSREEFLHAKNQPYSCLWQLFAESTSFCARKRSVILLRMKNLQFHVFFCSSLFDLQK